MSADTRDTKGSVPEQDDWRNEATDALFDAVIGEGTSGQAGTEAGSDPHASGGLDISRHKWWLVFAFLAFSAFTHCCEPIGRSVDRDR